MTAGSAPSFRWSVIAFAVLSALILLAATGLLVLLDPRSQAWWGAQFSSLGAFAHSLLAR